MKSYSYFQKDIVITGKHADYIDSLWTQGVIEESYIKRAVDLITIAAVIGLRADRYVEKADTQNDNKITVQLAQIMTVADDLKVIMQLILLLDKKSQMTKEQRVNRAFREPTSDEDWTRNMNTFYSYMRGGIEVLYEQLVLRTLTVDDLYTDKRIGNILALYDHDFMLD